MKIRQGTILILVAGITALLASIALAFIVRMRTDAEEMAIVVTEVQARIMLVSACSYIQEASRLGWDDPSTPEHEEAFGWVDVRDGKLGPKSEALGVDDDRFFPIGHVARYPRQVWNRPPEAIRLTTSYNPIRTPVSPDPVRIGDPAYGRPYLCNPDPLPVIDNGWPAAIASSAWDDYLRGDPKPRPQSTGMAWFRCYRDGPTTFVVTCGAGGTSGFRDWPEVQSLGEASSFQNDPVLFEEIRRSECRLWYLVEWSAAIMTSDYHCLDNGLYSVPDHYLQFPQNNSHYSAPARGPGHNRNMVGTISWIQRLRDEPARW